MRSDWKKVIKALKKFDEDLDATEFKFEGVRRDK